MRFKTASLGCKVNQYETQWIRTTLIANGWEDADAEGADVEPENVDLAIVNTCSVTSESDAKSRKLVSHFAREYPAAKIVVVGCWAASARDEVAKTPNVFAFEPDKRKLPELLQSLGATYFPTAIDSFAERRRAYVKVQDGCRVGCAYCIIPQTRPYLKSRPILETLEEARALAANGCREIVLTGIHLGHYGLDFCPPTPEEIALGDAFDPNASFPLETYLARRALTHESDRVDLASLLRALVELKLPLVRFRLGSLEAVEVGDRLLDVAQERPDAVCPHFHLSMQSGDDEILRAMKRRWASAPYIEKCQEIIERIPDVALSTDVIVGFPGETDAQFERTVEVVRRVGFSKTHVFRFSARPGAEASTLPRQVPPETKKARCAELMKVAQEEREKYARRFVGRDARMIVESVGLSAGRRVARGTTERYYDAEAPLEGDATVKLGDVARVKLVGLSGDVFQGRLL